MRERGKCLLKQAFGDSSMLHAMVFLWHTWFAVGEELIEDTEWNGRPGTMKTNENIARMAAEQWEQLVVHTKDLTIPAFSDLSPPNYFAFPKLKMELKGSQYATISDIQTFVTTKLKTIPITY